MQLKRLLQMRANISRAIQRHNTRMANLAIEYVKPGMVLDSDVKDRNGRLLLHSGTEIKEKHINIFLAWGIPEVDIRGVTKDDVASEMSDQVDPEILRKVEMELGDLFIHADREHPMLQELFRLCTLRRARTLAAGADDGT